MKKLIIRSLPVILFLTGTLFINTLAGQNKNKYKVVSILSQQDFYLNGGMWASVGGKSRIYLPIELPPNTVEWYYVFTTSENKTQGQSINLVTQLFKLVSVPGLSSIASLTTDAILAPAGVAKCDVY